MDIVEEFANPLPGMVIRYILRISDFDERPFLKDARTMVEYLSDPTDPELASAYPAAAQRLTSQFKDVVRQEQETPAGGFLSHLVEAEIEGTRLSEEELN